MNATRFKWLGYTEGMSFLLLLLFAMPLKYLAGMPLAVSIVGAAHGFFFVAYVAAAVYMAWRFNWGFKVLVLAVMASVIPFGPFLLEKRVLPSTEKTSN
ncbi:DUF3817 domain-containing protein [Exiguobacterium mexicanum]|uniref:DUF3817 domain-containing protein n=1 Tax=Exiguobacterium mexicanum TaxID=340146 RepID=A0ABT7MPA2_9BACL|nr:MULTISPECIES: DUF3817 domain-containing protein [Exiguobacterium]MDL5376995.1 DUF3817 domain-containing protein [Exiguobacterium mexicanum]